MPALTGQSHKDIFERGSHLATIDPAYFLPGERRRNLAAAPLSSEDMNLLSEDGRVYNVGLILEGA